MKELWYVISKGHLHNTLECHVCIHSTKGHCLKWCGFHLAINAILHLSWTTKSLKHRQVVVAVVCSAGFNLYPIMT